MLPELRIHLRPFSAPYGIAFSEHLDVGREVHDPPDARGAPAEWEGEPPCERDAERIDGSRIDEHRPGVSGAVPKMPHFKTKSGGSIANASFSENPSTKILTSTGIAHFFNAQSIMVLFYLRVIKRYELFQS